MTITVSVDELRAFEATCIAWAAKRADFYARQLVLVTDHANMRHAIHERGGTLEKMQAWDTENPPPRLVPAV
jgi:hypothetical protein